MVGDIFKIVFTCSIRTQIMNWHLAFVYNIWFSVLIQSKHAYIYGLRLGVLD